MYSGIKNFFESPEIEEQRIELIKALLINDTEKAKKQIIKLWKCTKQNIFLFIEGLPKIISIDALIETGKIDFNFKKDGAKISYRPISRISFITSETDGYTAMYVLVYPQGVYETAFREKWLCISSQ